MSASAEIGRHLCDIHRLAGAHTHLIFQHIRLIHEDCALNAVDISQLVHNPIEILGIHLVEIHGLTVNDADNTSVVHEADALHQRPAHDLRLEIGLLVKGLQNQSGKIKAVGNQLCALLQRLR